MMIILSGLVVKEGLIYSIKVERFYTEYEHITKQNAP